MKIFYILPFIFLFFNLNAQQNPIYLTGTILDEESNTPLEYATISVLNQNDSIVKYGGITDLNGKFNLKIIRGKYDIKLEYISFKEKYIRNISINKSEDLGTILMSVDENVLDEVELIGEKTEIEIKLDKTDQVYRLLFLTLKYDKKTFMKDKIEAVQEFHEAFKIGYRNSLKADLGLAKNTLRFNLMKEENEEYLEAAKNNDMVEVADALGDMLYILCGTIIEHGMQHKIETVFEEIQRSNMSKLGGDGKPIFREDGKVLKGPNYFKPKIKQILES